MSTATRTLAIAFAALAVVLGAVPAGAQARHGGHWGGHAWHGHGHGRGYWGHGPFWGVGIGFGLGYYYDPWYPGYVVVEPPVVYYYDEPQTEPREPPAKSPPNPIFYPRNGQSPAQTETDRQDCNRWTTTQPGAMASASVFHRMTLACMEDRGYTVQ